MSLEINKCFYCHKQFKDGEMVFHKADRAYTSHEKCYRKYKGPISYRQSFSLRKWEADNAND